VRNDVLSVHGVGIQVESAFAEVERQVRRAYAQEVRCSGANEPPDDALIWQSAWRAKVTGPDQNWLRSRLADKGHGPKTNKGFPGRRRGLLAPFGGRFGKYAEAQRMVHSAVESVARLADRRDAGDRVPLKVLSNSLGVVIATESPKRIKLPANLELRYFFFYGSP
jgi:hypothetical protein